MLPLWSISIGVAFVMSVIGYFLKRSMDQNDKKLEKLEAELAKLKEERNTDHSKIERLDEKVSNLVG